MKYVYISLFCEIIVQKILVDQISQSISKKQITQFKLRQDNISNTIELHDYNCLARGTTTIVWLGDVKQRED
jgi:hypothetical protein